MFAAELLFALPFSLTLQTFEEDTPEGTRSHQFARLSKRNVVRL